MIPTRVLTYVVRAPSVESASRITRNYAGSLIEETNATFGRLCNPPFDFQHEGRAIVGTVPSTHRIVRYPGAGPLTRAVGDDDETGDTVERCFTSLTADAEQITAFQEAFQEYGLAGIPTAVAAACVTVALSRTQMRYRHVVDTDATPPLEALDDSDGWYTGTGDDAYHPDLTARMAAFLADDDTRQALRTRLDEPLPPHHLFVEDTPVVTIGEFLEGVSEPPRGDEEWMVVSIDIGIGTGGA